MGFLPKLLKAFAFIPAVVHGIEALFGITVKAWKSGSE